MAIIDNRTGRGWLLPDPENKIKDDVLRLISALQSADGDVTEIIALLGQKAALDHDHGMADITGLIDALGEKRNLADPYALEDLSDVNVTGAADGQVIIRQSGFWIPINLQVGNITNLEQILGTKAPSADPTFTGVPKGPTAAPGTNTTQLATTSFVTKAFEILKGAVGNAYDTLEEIATFIQGLRSDVDGLGNRFIAIDFAQAFTAAQRTQGRQNLGINGGWATQPIGVPIPVWDNITGVFAPPTTESYRFVKLTASDAYNSGLLVAESVTGSAPAITATAVVAVGGSPIYNQQIPLINTERRFLRGGSSGVREASQNLVHSHGAQTGLGGAHNHSWDYAGAGGSDGSYINRMRRATTADGSYGTVTGSVVGMYDGPNHVHAIGNDGGTESRPHNMGVTYYMRVL